MWSLPATLISSYLLYSLHPFPPVKLSLILSIPSPTLGILSDWTILLHTLPSIKLSFWYFLHIFPSRWVVSNAFYTFSRPSIESSLMLSTPFPALRVPPEPFFYTVDLFAFVKTSLILFLHPAFFPCLSTSTVWIILNLLSFVKSSWMFSAPPPFFESFHSESFYFDLLHQTLVVNHYHYTVPSIFWWAGRETKARIRIIG